MESPFSFSNGFLRPPIHLPDDPLKEAGRMGLDFRYAWLEEVPGYEKKTTWQDKLSDSKDLRRCVGE